MSDLIWIGNTLYPRGLVIVVASVMILAVVGTLTYLTREH